MSMRTIVVALAAPLVLAAACAQDGGSEGTLTVVESDAAHGVVRAEYRAGSELVRIATRRIVIERDAGGTTRFLPVDGAATRFQVEVRVEDMQRQISLTWRGGKVDLESRAASAIDKNQAIALFIDAMDALADSDAVATSERRALTDLAGGAASHPGFDERLETYDEAQGCIGTADKPTFSITSVYGTGTIECVEGGKYAASVCIRGQRTPTFFHSESEIGCNDTAEKKFEDPEGGGTITIELEGADKADVWCGELGKTYSYTTTVKMVNDEDWFFNDWQDMGESGPASHMCGQG